MEKYLISYQKPGLAPVVYVACENNLMATVNQALKEADAVPVLISLCKTI